MVWEEIERIYKELHTENKYSQIKMTMFNSKSQPQLKGKAAEVRDLSPVMARVWKKIHNPGMSVHRNILVVLEGSAHLDQILNDHPNDIALPEDAANDLIATAFIMLSTWLEFFEHFKDCDVLLFGLTGKGHQLMHACLLSRLGCLLKLSLDIGAFKFCL